jgi:predicted dehydrogenase
MSGPIAAATHAVPRLGFLGVGWIGLKRMQALASSGAGIVAAIGDSSPQRAGEARAVALHAPVVDSLDALLELELDGIIIATPSGLHAEQCVRALERGFAVFCQKPLARTAAETRAVIAAARAADRLLGIDLSYRFTDAMQAVRRVVRAGMIGDVFAAELVFHNAYGPDPGWARDALLAGGGCMIDLGVHLVDLALWTLDFPRVRSVSAQLFARGRRIEPGSAVCEDYALATIELESGSALRIVCSWEAHAARDAIIEASFYGTSGSAAMRNVGGSFYDFTAVLRHGASSHALSAPPDDWGGRGIIDWSRRLAGGARYDPAIETAITVAQVLDGALGR